MFVAMLVLCGAWVINAPAAAAAAPRYYLSLGDSLAFGFQRAKVGSDAGAAAFTTGYSDVLAARLEHGDQPLTLVNYGCPGESTISFRTGGCPWTASPLHDPYAGSQREAALAFLAANPGRVDLVTVSLWGNDATAFIASCAGNVQCIQQNAPAAIATIAARLGAELAEIRRAAPDAQLVVLGAYDVNAGHFDLTHPLVASLNLALADVAHTARAEFANPFPVFNPPGDTGAALCPLTGLCTNGDVHPSDAGYRALANVIAAQLRPGQS